MVHLYLCLLKMANQTNYLSLHAHAAGIVTEFSPKNLILYFSFFLILIWHIIWRLVQWEPQSVGKFTMELQDTSFT